MSCKDCKESRKPIPIPNTNNVTRASCFECVEKHLGSAMVLYEEIKNGYDHSLLFIGHMNEAESESQEMQSLNHAIRQARIKFQRDRTSPNFNDLSDMIKMEKAKNGHNIHAR